MKRLVLHPAADAEADAAAAWYDAEESGLGRAFTEELAKTLGKIAASPDVGSPYGRSGFRVVATHRFPYAVYYRERSPDVWVAAVAHQRRRPGYWRRRKAST